MWFGLSVPITFIGAYLGSGELKIEHPTQTNQIPRPIPKQSFYKRPLVGIVTGALPPFGCINIQLFIILNNIWSHHIFNFFGFLFLVPVILVVACSLITILWALCHLCAEDYRWWWQSFFSSGFTAVYCFLYCIHFFFTQVRWNIIFV